MSRLFDERIRPDRLRLIDLDLYRSGRETWAC